MLQLCNAAYTRYAWKRCMCCRTSLRVEKCCYLGRIISSSSPRVTQLSLCICCWVAALHEQCHTVNLGQDVQERTCSMQASTPRQLGNELKSTYWHRDEPNHHQAQHQCKKGISPVCMAGYSSLMVC